MPLLSSTSLSGMSSIWRRRSAAPIRSLSSSLQISGRNSPADSQFKPLYSVSSQRDDPQRTLSVSGRQQVRFANTSSGFFAPSTMASRRMNNEEAQGNLNVFDDSEHLPSLHVPNLNGTLEKLKESISPVAMNSAEFVGTLQLIDKFAKSAGPKLDLILREKANQTKNWLTHDWWTREIYLRSRQPLVINSSPSMIYPSLPFEVNSQRALVSVISQLISGIIDFKLALIQGYNPEATSADNECRLDPNLCYHQYQNIFGSTRVPGEFVDSLQVKSLTSGLDDSTPFSIVISYRGKFFQIQLNEIEDEKGRIDKLAGIIDKIVDSQKDDVGVDGGQIPLAGAGVLTTARRDDWAKAIKLLDGDSLNSIREAQFVVCIDTIPAKPDKFSRSLLASPIGSAAHQAALGRQVLHSDSANVGNRWFDKSLQLIVVADERAESLLGAGINYEHSFGEGMIVSKMIEYSFDKTVQKHRESNSTKDNFFATQQISSQSVPAAVFRQLRMFDESNLVEIVDHLRRAKQDFVSQVDQFDLSYLDYKNYGSNAIKSWHFSPDSWFQVAIQAGYYNLHKRLGTCYESASTRKFAYGRTETIRSLTKELAQFCLEPNLATLQAAIQSHKAYARSACNGDAIDRVLMGYKMAFNELRSSTWTWGLPTELAASNNATKKQRDDESETGCLKEPSMSSSIEDIFTEKDLNTISSFFGNELIKRSSRFALSTSQVSSVHPNIYMTYGPLLADGYGCCYNISGQQIVAAITANSSNQSFSCEVHKLNESIRNSLDRMSAIAAEQRPK